MLPQKWLGHSVTSDDGVTKAYNQFGKRWTSHDHHLAGFVFGLGLQRWSVCSSCLKQKNLNLGSVVSIMKVAFEGERFDLTALENERYAL